MPNIELPNGHLSPACVRSFDEWYDILCSISEKEQEKRIKIMLQSERYKQLQVITPKGYLNQTFLFWWTIRYAVSETEEQRKAELDTLVTMIPKTLCTSVSENDREVLYTLSARLA